MDEAASTTTSPTWVRDLAAMCKRIVHSRVGIPLDGTPETLPLLDHYLLNAALEPSQAETVSLVAAAAGAYFGELVCARYPCRWHAPENDWAGWRIEFETVFLHFSPVAFAHEAIFRQGLVQDGAGFGVLDQDIDAVREGLDALGMVEEDEYYALSTRWEVLATVFDRLVGRAQSDAEGATTVFDASTYRAALDGVPGEAS